jgi:NADH-quinone oxidoreductase subunit E
MPIALSAEREKDVERILARYPNRQAALIPILHVYQEEKGWLDDDAMQAVALRLGLSAAHVKGVVTFYTLFNQHPVGEHQVWVCRTLSCALRGSDAILHHCEKRLGIQPGETTRDGKVTLRTAECLASCGTGPMMQVDKDYYENLTPDAVDQVLEKIGATLGGPGR